MLSSHYPHVKAEWNIFEWMLPLLKLSGLGEISGLVQEHFRILIVNCSYFFFRMVDLYECATSHLSNDLKFRKL